MHRFIRVLGISFFFLMTLLSAAAQEAAQGIVINYPEVTENGDEQQLGLYFTVVDNNRRVVTDAEVESAVVLLDTDPPQRLETTNIAQPDTPLYITLVLDTSGSMQGTDDDMRNAAIQAINNAPANAQFSVITFNTTLSIVQNFSPDTNAAINAVGAAVAVPGGGTCLYDAVYQAVNVLSQDVPQPARRAVIVFTDGRDEIVRDGDPCSQRTLDEVTDLARQSNAQVPIHTIGLQGDRAIAETELETMSMRTGGLSRIGNLGELNTLFSDIMDGLRSQLLAQVPICVEAGTYSATMRVSLARGGELPAESANFAVTTNCYPATETPTPTATNTPEELYITITESYSYNQDTEIATFEVQRHGDGEIAAYRIQVNNSLGAERIDEEIAPDSGLVTTIRLSLADLEDGQFTVIVTALDSNGEPLTSTSQQFGLARPTATPTITQTPTATEAPVSLEVDSISFDEETQTIQIGLFTQNEERITSIELQILGNGGLVIATYSPDVGNQLSIPLTGLTPGQSYTLRIIAEIDDGTRLRADEAFGDPRMPSATPSATPPPTATPEPTATPAVDLSFTPLVDDAAQQITLEIPPQESTAIDRYQIRLFNRNRVEREEIIEPEGASETITIAFPETIEADGEYRVEITVFAADNSVLDAVEEEVTILVPPTPTPTPAPSLPERMVTTLQSNPISILGVVILVLALIVFVAWLWRRQGNQSEDTFYPYPESSMARMEAIKPEMLGGGVTMVEDDGKTMIDMDLLPLESQARIVVTKISDRSLLNEEFMVETSIYTIGRMGCDLNLTDQEGVSRQHAILEYEGGAYYITDSESSNGTFIGSRKLRPHERTRITLPSTVVRLGRSVEITIFPPDEKTQIDESSDEG